MTNEEKLAYLVESHRLSMRYRLWDMPEKSFDELKTLDDQYWREFSKALLPRIPKVLYRYRPLTEYSIDELEHGYAWFSKPADFDDGTDSTLNTDIESELEDFEKSPENVLIRFTKAIILQQYRKITGQEPDPKLIQEGIKLFPNGNLDTESLKEAFMRYSPEENPDLFIAMLERANNRDFSTEFEKPLKDMFDYYMGINELTRSNLFCLCLAEEYSNDVMWAKYAGERTGFCIGYEIPNSDLYGQKILMALNPIYYGEKKPMRFFDIMIDGITAQANDQINGWSRKTYEDIAIATLTKPSDWSFQKEWRVVFNLTAGNNRQHFPYIKSIYLGEKMLPEHRIKLLDLAKKNKWETFERKINKSGSKVIYRRIGENE